MSILLHGCLWKGLTKSSLLYRLAWTPGAEGSVTQWLCWGRWALFFHLSAPSCSFSSSPVFKSAQLYLWPFHEERKGENNESGLCCSLLPMWSHGLHDALFWNGAALQTVSEWNTSLLSTMQYILYLLYILYSGYYMKNSKNHFKFSYWK